MNYTEAIDFIHSIPKFRRPLGNENLKKLLDCLDNPQDSLEFVHIAGTNGKGSTAAMIAAVLKEQGYKTGLFTSPFIEVFNERIQINGRNISDGELAEYTQNLKNAMEGNDAPVSEFAFITAAAMLYFADMDCDFVVLETGMGGRLDATNIIEKSVVSVLTSIGLDHTQYLGDTIEEIAEEKCGIIKESGTVVSVENESVMPIIKESCKNKNADLIIAGKAEKTEYGIRYKNRDYPLNLKGGYQLINSAAALEALYAMQSKGITISDEAIKNGFKHVEWKVRFEFVRDNVIIDGAHNIDAMKQLKKSLVSLDRRVIGVIAMMEDKAYAESVREISEVFDKIIVTELDMPRCVNAEKLSESINGGAVVENSVRQAIERALAEAEDEDIICVCGSLYLAGEARVILKNI